MGLGFSKGLHLVERLKGQVQNFEGVRREEVFL
jgi:hypothetical protein